MALPNPNKHIAPPGRSPAPMVRPGFVKVFASPGIDSKPDEVGVYASGAGLRPDSKTFKIWPWDWFNESPSQGHSTEKFIGGFAATQAPSMETLKIRRRGVTPWGGLLKQHPHSLQHPGGNQDLNPGADYKIAGGVGAASSMVRINSNRNERPNQGMKLPVLPQGATRSGLAAFPAGGSFDSAIAAPIMPRMSGWPTIFSFRSRAAVAAR